jgi:hypothetical protein
MQRRSTLGPRRWAEAELRNGWFCSGISETDRYRLARLPAYARFCRGRSRLGHLARLGARRAACARCLAVERDASRWAVAARCLSLSSIRAEGSISNPARLEEVLWRGTCVALRASSAAHASFAKDGGILLGGGRAWQNSGTAGFSSMADCWRPRACRS